MKNRILDSILFKKEKAESLKNIRIIKTNLVHVHGFPKSFAESSILKSPEYFGQYGTIVKTIISSKCLYNLFERKRSSTCYSMC